MKSVEFNTIIHNGIIEVPKDKDEIKDKEVKVTIVWDDKNDKNFDASKLALLLSDIRKKGAFENIMNPSAWQKNLRDEWE